MRGSRVLLAWMVLCSMPLSALEPAAERGGSGGSVLSQAFRAAWRGAGEVRYAAPQVDAQWQATEALMLRMLRGERGEAIHSDAAELGWRVRRGRTTAGSWTVLEEMPDRRSGRGLYAFADEGGRHAIQAPHVPSDLHTGEIAVALGEEGKPRAIAWNTVHRRVADLPRLDNSAMHAFSRAFARQHAQERVVQLHGFDAERGDRAEDRQRDAILSSTTARPSAEFHALAECMRRHVEPGTRLFGVDARKLGGTRNRIAGELIASGFRGFIHLEMGLTLRLALRDDPRRRASLLTCLGIPQ